MLLIGSLVWICSAPRLPIVSIHIAVESFRLQPVWELAPWRVIQMHYSAGIKKLKNQIDLKVKIAAKVLFVVAVL